MAVSAKTRLYLIFALSGFSGLIYESIWTHYLKLFLGHAAYAQTLVLGIFMGGMAAGAWLCSRRCGEWRNLLAGYALVEGVIGVCSLFFHEIFDAAVTLAFSSLIPAIGSPLGVTAFKWLLAALLILPQSVLLGMTFPLMSGGILRRFPGNPGRTVSVLYFANSIGAAAGVLASGFVLVGLVGLPGTIRIAGILNIGLALTVWRLFRDREQPQHCAERPASGDASLHRLMLAAALATGAASFLYEIGWIRMLSLVLGSSTHAFELMLSAFILGLALGGFWIRRRIDGVADPVRLLARVQVGMGLLALGTLPLYAHSFRAMQLLLQVVGRTPAGYAAFNLASHGIALGVMLPATFCAGMTLPLVTCILISRGEGERSIGAVYAANTVGAIIGIFIAIHAAMPLFGVQGVVTLGAALDMALGLVLLRRGKTWGKRERLAAFAVPAAVAAAIFLAKPDPYKMASGVYRDGQILSPEHATLVYHRDGKTSTVTASLQEGKLGIRTNGKVDGAVVVAEGAPANYDETTMILTGVIPMALHPRAKTVANIGLGTGLTTQTILGNPQIRSVDTVEIERCMVEGARNFGPRVERVYSDPRSRIHIDDAKTFFSTYRKSYDLIISEPSNPWVSGVAGLFSKEFYELVSRHLNPGGMLVQWMQLYEIDPTLVASVLKAVGESFEHYAVYAPDDGDLLIVARNGAPVGNLDAGVLSYPEVARALERIDIRSLRDLEMRKIGDKGVMQRLAGTYPVAANSDYRPVLDQKAARARFLQKSGQDLISFIYDPLPVREMLAGDPPPAAGGTFPSPYFPKSVYAARALLLRDWLLTGKEGDGFGSIPPGLREEAGTVRRFLLEGVPAADEEGRIRAMFNTMIALSHLPSAEQAALWRRLPWKERRFLTPRERSWLALYEAAARRDGSAMAAEALQIIHGSTVPPQMLKFAIAAGMLGEISCGREAEALRLWKVYRPVMYADAAPDPLFRLLLGYAANPSPRSRS